MAVVAGFALYGFADVIALGLLRRYIAFPSEILSSMVGRLGIFTVGMGILGVILVNYLQFGVFLPRSQDVVAQLHPLAIATPRGTAHSITNSRPEDMLRPRQLVRGRQRTGEDRFS
jgi:hypothetical protein